MLKFKEMGNKILSETQTCQDISIWAPDWLICSIFILISKLIYFRCSNMANLVHHVVLSIHECFQSSFLFLSCVHHILVMIQNIEDVFWTFLTFLTWWVKVKISSGHLMKNHKENSAHFFLQKILSCTWASIHCSQSIKQKHDLA